MGSRSVVSQEQREINTVITSLLDLDFYKLSMGQVQWHNYRDVQVRLGFKNRTTKVRLGEAIDPANLKREFEYIRTLRFQDDELHYLSQIDCGDRAMFAPAYLDFLSQLQLPVYALSVQDGQLDITFEGAWSEVSLWETIALSITNELYYRSLVTSEEYERALAVGRERLQAKIVRIRSECPDVKFSDFGTRRRFSREWQEEVATTLARELPHNFLGTSCVDIARRNNLKPMGTSAHEMYMVLAALSHESDEAIRRSHNRLLRDWWAAYGKELSIALTDTFGTQFFFQDMTAKQASDWKGLRHDSADPFAFGERAIRFYEGHAIAPQSKFVVFSDGLDLDMIIRLFWNFHDRIGTTFGWGTNLTNDMGLSPLSLVVKPTMANGKPTVKLSDNLAKATGPRGEVERYKRIFGYTGTLDQQCIY